MVDPDTFLTALYVMVDDLLSQIPLPAPRRRGPALALTRSEVVTLALYGQWAHFEGEAAFYRHADARLRGAFPRLPAHSQYNRAVRACHDAIVAVGQRLARLLDAATCAYEALDSTGVVTRNSKRRGHGWLDGQANKGWCTRLGWYHGLHLLVAVMPLGALTGFGLAPASVADQDLAESFFALRHGRHPAVPEVGRPADGVYVADTGFEGDARWHTWASAYGAEVVCPPKPKRRRARRWPKALRRAHAARRQIIETVNDRLLETFGLEHERPHSLEGVRARLAAKAGLHNFCLWLNTQLGRPPLAVADLVEWP